MAIHYFIHRFTFHDELFNKYEDKNVVILDDPTIDSDSSELPQNYDQIFEFKLQ